MPINSFLYPGAKVTTGYDVANSCRFDDGSSSYLHKTPSSGGNRRTFTFSTWFKRGTGFGNEQAIFTGGNDANASGFFTIYFTTNDRIDAHFWNGSSFDSVTPNGVLRDSSAWTHIVVAVDTTQATDSNRIKWYINGTEQTSLYSTDYPTQNHEFNVNHTAIMQVGVRRNGSGALIGYYDGYLAETVLIDGTQLDATSFGEFDSDSPTIWKPKDVSGLTFGTNGFYLDFEDSSTLGNDVSGNNNDFTSNNISATDQSTDTCTNNFATINPLDNYYFGGTFSDGNLTVQSSSSPYNCCTSTFGVSSGKWYVEAKLSSGTKGIFGVTPKNSTSTSTGIGNSGFGVGVQNTGSLKNDGSTTTSWSNTYTTNDILQVALDLDNNKFYFGINGTFQNSANPSAGTNGVSIITPSNTATGFYFFGFSDNNTGSDNSTFQYNFGSPPYSISSGNSDGNGYGNFEYSVPSGYYSINTKNLAEFG